MQAESSPTGRRRSSFIERARRKQVIKAAAETMAQIGYVNASLTRIAEQAGISKSVISYRFEGTGELMVLVAEQFIEAASEHMFTRVGAEPAAAGRSACGSGARWSTTPRTGPGSSP